MCDEGTLERYLERGQVEPEEIRALVEGRRLFPCWFGSALKLEGVAEFLEGVEQYAPRKCCPPQFGARVCKVARDAQGVRLTYLKITGGSLRVKTPPDRRGGRCAGRKSGPDPDLLRGQIPGRGGGGGGDRLRCNRAEPHQAGERGWALRRRDSPGAGAGAHRLELPEGCDPHAVSGSCGSWRRRTPSSTSCGTSACGRSISSSWGRCSWRSSARSSPSGSAWRSPSARGASSTGETIAAPVEGVGHFEPLRHYAEVHLLLGPGSVAAACG